MVKTHEGFIWDPYYKATRLRGRSFDHSPYDFRYGVARNINHGSWKPRFQGSHRNHDFLDLQTFFWWLLSGQCGMSRWHKGRFKERALCLMNANLRSLTKTHIHIHVDVYACDYVCRHAVYIGINTNIDTHMVLDRNIEHATVSIHTRTN